MTIAIITGVFFGLVHACLGWKGILITGLMEFAPARMYIAYDYFAHNNRLKMCCNAELSGYLLNQRQGKMLS